MFKFKRIKIKRDEYRFVVGSRMVVKSIDGDDESAGKQHFYADDLWTEYAERNALAAQIPEGFLVYGEIVGHTYDGKTIQKSYDYGYDRPEFFIYRVATITPQGRVTDLSWEATKRFAKDIGVRYVPELAVVEHYDFRADDWMDRKYYENYLEGFEFNETPVPLSPDSPCDEGVCVRWDGPNGIYILKAKAPLFLGYETKMLDAGEEDTESQESA